MFLTDLADKLRHYTAPDGSKLTVIEAEGWKSRTYDAAGMAGNIGVLWHHTATASASAMTTGAPTLNMCINGRSDLPGPLANIVFRRGGEIYVIAAGQANHAGRGSVFGTYQNAGNYYLIGIEMESSGTSDDWTEAQRRVAPYLAAALDKAYSNGGDYYQIGHKEYSYEGKIDPAYWDMDSFRSEINDILSSEPAHAVAAVTSSTENEEEMSTEEFFTTKRPAWGNRSLDEVVRELDRNTWNTKKMVNFLFGQFRIGIPGRMTDGSLGSGLRKLLGYNEATQGKARRDAWDAEAKRNFDF